MGRHGDTAGHGHGNLLVLMLVLLVACRGLGAHHLSVLLRLESLRALVALEFAQISTADGTHARTGPDTQRFQAHKDTTTRKSATHERTLERRFLIPPRAQRSALTPPPALRTAPPLPV